MYFFPGRLWIIEQLVKLRYQSNHAHKKIINSYHKQLFERHVCLFLSQPLQRPEEESLVYLSWLNAVSEQYMHT